MAIVALGGLEVCDGGHWLVVMKKGQRPGPSEGLDTAPSKFQPPFSTKTCR
jgi:hypothetical protein